MKQRLAALIALAALVLGIGAPAGAQPAPLEINVMLSLSGPVSFLGKAEQAAFDTLETMVNKKGGIDGRIRSRSSSPTIPRIRRLHCNLRTAISRKACRCFSARRSHRAVSRSWHSSRRRVRSTTASRRPSARRRAATFSRPVRVPSTNRPRSCSYLKDRGFTRIALLNTTDATGHDFENSYVTVLGRPEYKSSTIVADEHFAPTDISVAAQLAHIKAANPQVLVMGTIGLASGTIFPRRARYRSRRPGRCPERQYALFRNGELRIDVAERTALPGISRDDRRRCASGSDQGCANAVFPGA